MDKLRIFMLCVPSDDEWTRALSERLREDGYALYIEPSDAAPDDERTIQRTAKALQAATVLIAVVSTESAIGESAAVFEQWWRPYLNSGRKVIPCLAPYAPAGAAHWMPYDLYRQSYVDFQREDAYAELKVALGEAPRRRSADASSEAASESAPPEADNMDFVPSPVRPVIGTPPRPPIVSAPRPLQVKAEPAPAPVAPADAAAPLPTEPPTKPPGVFSTLFSLVIGFGLVIVMWLGALSSTSTPAVWLFGLMGLVLCLFLLGQIARARRKRRWEAEQKRQAALERGKAGELDRLPAYLEVIDSKAKDEIGEVWLLDRSTLTIGRSSRSDVPLHDPQLDRQHCLIYFDEGRYYLENTSPSQRTVVVGQQLEVGEVAALQNGDLITLGKGLVLQIRINPRT